ncbi:MAG: hypothetical protein V1892_00625 [bacterium]
MNFLFWFGLGLVLISIGIALVYLFVKDKVMPIALVILVIIGSAAIKNASMDELQENLRKEVPLQKVTIKGEQIFEAKVKIIYKNGEAEPARLVPNSTIQVETKETEEKSQ